MRKPDKEMKISKKDQLGIINFNGLGFSCHLV